MHNDNIIIRIPHQIQSQNPFIFSHWRKYHKYKKSWLNILTLFIGEKREKTKEYKHIKIMSVRTRELDYGNLVGGSKPIPDCLKTLGWIKDDSPKWVNIKYDQRKPMENEKTPLTIIEIER